MYWPIGVPNYYSTSKRCSAESATDSGSETQATRSQANGSEQELDLEDEHGSIPHLTASTDDLILDVKASRGAQLFATITRHSLSIWQTKPTVVLATAVRSKQSLDSYGDNKALLIRPDALIVVVQTSGGFLITYSLAFDPNAQVYRLAILNSASNRRQSGDAIRRGSAPGPEYGAGDGQGIRDVSIRFRMVLRIDAGICCAIALEDEIMVATAKPAAVQCIRWSPDKTGSSHNTEVLKRIPWFAEHSVGLAKMTYNRPMGLHIWLSSDGRVYAVQRSRNRTSTEASSNGGYKGYCFHTPASEEDRATHMGVNARFSLLAVGCEDASIRVYTAKDYTGNIPLSHVLLPPVSAGKSGKLLSILHSPDGYSLFAGYEHGWASWSVYGKPGATSFSSDSDVTDHWWLRGWRTGFFAGSGSELFFLATDRTQICSLNMARFAIGGCFDMGNIHHALLQTSCGLMTYRQGTDVGRDAAWQTIRYPATYIARQWPVRYTATSADGKYVAIAGRRGLAHYSTVSGRWKTFDDDYAEDEFAVRGGMCWFQHILVVAVEAEGQSQIRLYSREKPLATRSAVYAEELQHAVIHVALQDANSLLVYTYENVLLHYMFDASSSAVRLINVGQIGFGGIIRSPARVRSISWIMPDEQRERGDPSQDVAKAAVVFLLDGKLVLLQPAPELDRELKYDMRVIANNVEYYLLARQGVAHTTYPLGTLDDEAPGDGAPLHTLQDSLWYFNGVSMHVWPDVHELVSFASSELHQATPSAVEITTDFYPLTPLLGAGTLVGLESALVLRRDADMAYFRCAARTQLFIPALLRHHLSRFDSPAALHLSDAYKSLPYFAHGLEVLLHDVLDDEVEEQDTQLASLLPFLSSFPAYLDIILGCARKTELRSWQTLFSHLPPVSELFETALREGKLKTAGGYLLVLHTFDEERFTAAMMARLLQAARAQDDWELCKELARFLVGVDKSGELLRKSLVGAGMA